MVYGAKRQQVLRNRLGAQEMRTKHYKHIAAQINCKYTYIQMISPLQLNKRAEIATCDAKTVHLHHA